VVTAEDMAWGRDLARWSARLTIKDADAYMADTKHEADKKKVLAVIRAAWRIKRSALTRKLQEFDARTLDGLCMSLDDAEQIDTVQSPATGSAGRRATEYIYRG
jgi:hypothetical protein